MAASPICKVDLLMAGPAETFGKTGQGTFGVRRSDPFGPALRVFVTAPDGLRLHVRSYGSRVAPRCQLCAYLVSPGLQPIGPQPRDTRNSAQLNSFPGHEPGTSNPPTASVSSAG
jgi:hypothetical protein